MASATASPKRASSSPALSSSSQTAFMAPITPLTDIGRMPSNERGRDVLAGVVGVDALDDALVDRVRPRAGQLLPERLPDEPEAGVADAVGALAGAAALVVVEVAGRGLGAPADVDAEVRGRQRGLVAGADDVQRPVDEARAPRRRRRRRRGSCRDGWRRSSCSGPGTPRAVRAPCSHRRSSCAPPTVIPNSSRSTSANSGCSSTRLESTSGPTAESVRARSVTIRSTSGFCTTSVCTKLDSGSVDSRR